MYPAISVGVAIVAGVAMILILALLVGDGSDSVQSNRQEFRPPSDPDEWL